LLRGPGQGSTKDGTELHPAPVKSALERSFLKAEQCGGFGGAQQFDVAQDHGLAQSERQCVELAPQGHGET